MEINDQNRIMSAALAGIPKEEATKTPEEAAWYDQMIAAQKRVSGTGIELDTAEE